MYNILKAELGNFVNKEAILQMAIKALNNTAGPDDLVSTLLVFGAYPPRTAGSATLGGIAKHSEAMQKAIDTLQKIVAKRKVEDNLNTRKGPPITDVLKSPL